MKKLNEYIPIFLQILGGSEKDVEAVDYSDITEVAEEEQAVKNAMDSMTVTKKGILFSRCSKIWIYKEFDSVG